MRGLIGVGEIRWRRDVHRILDLIYAFAVVLHSGALLETASEDIYGPLKFILLIILAFAAWATRRSNPSG